MTYYVLNIAVRLSKLLGKYCTLLTWKHKDMWCLPSLRCTAHYYIVKNFKYLQLICKMGHHLCLCMFLQSELATGLRRCTAVYLVSSFLSMKSHNYWPVESIDKLVNLSKIWQLQINLNKCHILSIRAKPNSNIYSHNTLNGSSSRSKHRA